MSTFLAFDLGAESGRAVLGHFEAGALRLEEVHRFANTSSKINGCLHWNLLSTWENLKTGLRAAGSKCAKIQGLGVDTWGVDFAFVGENGDLLGNPVCYRDSRTDGMLEKACEVLGRQRIFETTGIQFQPFNTLYQLLAMRTARSHLLDVPATLLFMPDLLNYFFTGRRVSEVSIASTSQIWNPRERCWAVDLLVDLGMRPDFLPQVVASGTPVGSLRADVAAECGTTQFTVLAPPEHDTASAVAAIPFAGAERACYISSGTWSLMGVELPEPIITAQSLQYNYTNEAGIAGTTRFLKNIMGLWLVQECRRQWHKEGREYTYAQLTHMAGEASSFKALLNPNWGPLLTPGQMPSKIDEFCLKTHQTPPTKPGEYVRACLESLALCYRRTLDELEEMLGHRLDVIHVAGGGSQNNLLNQMTANACERPVLAGPVEATAIGNLLSQALAMNVIPSLAEGRKMVRECFPLRRFEPQDTVQWGKAYQRYRELNV